MFYAIEYAYGRNMINNGNRADRVMEFSAKQLRDVWVAAGSSDVNSAGARDALKARDSRVRGVQGLEDGDNDGWRVMAEQRGDKSVALGKYRAILFYDWAEREHNKWVATAPERDILSWVKDTEAAAYEVEQEATA